MTQDSTLTEEQIQEQIIKAEDVGKDPIENIAPKGDEALPLGTDDVMTATRVSSAGYKYLWDTETKERVPILYYMLPQQLRKKRADGQPRFSATKPIGEPFRGKIKCMLHRDNPQRVYFDTLGLRTCRKDNIPNPHALTQHMRLKHPQEWKLIEEEKKEKERQEDRALQMAVLNRIVPEKGTIVPDMGTPEAPLYVSDKPKRGRKKK